MTTTKFYRSYYSMKRRCYDENNDRYNNYGGRGIIVCDRWNDPENGFINFKEDMYDSFLKHIEEYGEENTTIDRINVNGNYEPSNCKWSTNKEQSNNKTNNHYIEYNGELLSLSLLVDKYADCRLEYDTIKARLYAGWDIDKALHTLPNDDKLVKPIRFIDDNK